MQKDVKRAVSLDRETDQLLARLARKYEDNRSLCVRELIRAAARSTMDRSKSEAGQAVAVR